MPQHVTLTDLWLGISAGTWGLDEPHGGPVGMSPILVHEQSLAPGSHTITLRWHAAAPAGGRLYLTYAWSSHQPPAAVSGPIAQLVPDSYPGIEEGQADRLLNQGMYFAIK